MTRNLSVRIGELTSVGRSVTKVFGNDFVMFSNTIVYQSVAYLEICVFGEWEVVSQHLALNLIMASLGTELP